MLLGKKLEILIRMWEAFRNLKADGKLHHGSGTFDYGDWGVWLEKVGCSKDNVFLVMVSTWC